MKLLIVVLLGLTTVAVAQEVNSNINLSPQQAGWLRVGVVSEARMKREKLHHDANVNQAMALLQEQEALEKRLAQIRKALDDLASGKDSSVTASVNCHSGYVVIDGSGGLVVNDGR